jgi:hypothetical protein
MGSWMEIVCYKSGFDEQPPLMALQIPTRFEYRTLWTNLSCSSMKGKMNVGWSCDTDSIHITSRWRLVEVGEEAIQLGR